MSTPEPIEVTEEMRLAVYEADCTLYGHLLLFNRIMQGVGGGGAAVAGIDGQMPYVTCSRCRKVWLLMEEAAPDYLKALEKLSGRLKDGDTLKERIDKKIKERKAKESKA